MIHRDLPYQPYRLPMISALFAFCLGLSLIPLASKAQTADPALIFQPDSSAQDYNYRLIQLEKRLEELEARLNALESTLGGSGDAGFSGSGPGVITYQDPLNEEGFSQRPSFSDPLSPTGSEPAQPPLLSAADAFDLAYGSVTRGEYDIASHDLRQFMITYPDDPAVPKARYWLGQSLYALGNYTESATTFLDLYKTDKQGSYAPDSLFMLGRSLSGLGKEAQACATWKEIGKSYADRRLEFHDDWQAALATCP